MLRHEKPSSVLDTNADHTVAPLISETSRAPFMKALGSVDTGVTVGEQLVSNLNVLLLQEHKNWQRSTDWSGEFTVAVWLRIPEGLAWPLQLLLKYKDKERTKTILIDRCLPDDQHRILLNGCVNIKVVGAVSEMEVYLKSPGLTELNGEKGIQVEECLMQAKDKKKREKCAAESS